MIVVLVLIGIAVAGLFLAARKSGSDLAANPAPVPAPVVAQAASAVASEPTREVPAEVVFPYGADRVPPSAAATVAHWVEKARMEDKKLRISAHFLTGANKERDMALAKARTSALHHAAMSNGLTGDKLQIELVEMPDGAMQPGDAERVRFSLI